MTSRTKTLETLWNAVGNDGLEALVAEGCRRGLTVSQIADKLNIPHDNARIFAVGHEPPLKVGDRIRALVPSVFGWQGYGTVTHDQIGNAVRFRVDGYPPDIIGDDEDAYQWFDGGADFCRHEVELSDMPELLPEGATYNEYGILAIPCDLSPKGTQLVFYCPHCKQSHRHGVPGGYRASHCTKKDSPLNARGEYVVFQKVKH